VDFCRNGDTYRTTTSCTLCATVIENCSACDPKHNPQPTAEATRDHMRSLLSASFVWILSGSVVYALEPLDVPSFHTSDLRHGGMRDSELRRILQSTGLLSIEIPSDLSNAMKDLCSCQEHLEPSVGVSSMLHRGTERATLASATIGNTPLPLQGPCAKDSLDIPAPMAPCFATLIAASTRVFLK